jgi:hypothetical protein
MNHAKQHIAEVVYLATHRPQALHRRHDVRSPVMQ